MRTITTLILAAAVSFPLAAAENLRDRHLRFEPRTADETEHVKAVTRPTTDFSAPEQFEANSAGDATVRPRNTRDAFSLPSRNMGFDKQLFFKAGEGLFNKRWVAAPSSTPASDGLGPLFNARSCQSCHINGGRGHPSEGPENVATPMVLQISIHGYRGHPIIADYVTSFPEPTYGEQIQDFSVAGHPPEAKIRVTYTEETVALSGGQTASLRHPSYEITDLAYGPLHPEVMISPRIAPQLIGLGLLNAIPTADIVARTDPDDADQDGISGRAQIVIYPLYFKPVLGRFGHKAAQPSLWPPIAAAFAADIGISTTRHPEAYGDCTNLQPRCRLAPDGNTAEHDDAEISDKWFKIVAFHSENLGVPARRDVGDPQVLRGKQVFYETGCTACHTPKHVTHRLRHQSEQSFQLIWPYTDLLLHDMGPDLADNRPVARATAREWRTPPLWGIGMTETVSGHTYFLHDGRARNLLEAILWHGGEAEVQKQSVIDMPPPDRDALIRFLESL